MSVPGGNILRDTPHFNQGFLRGEAPFGSMRSTSAILPTHGSGPFLLPFKA
jgi:hypothetical protein